MLVISDKLYEYLQAMDKDQLLEVMGNALDMMQMYNNRSHTFCIVSSIEDALVTETDEGGYEYRLPSLEIV